MRDLWAALCLVLILEGLLPVLCPGALRRAWDAGARLPDGTVRAAGLGSMFAGLLLLYLVH